MILNGSKSIESVCRRRGLLHAAALLLTLVLCAGAFSALTNIVAPLDAEAKAKGYKPAELSKDGFAVLEIDLDGYTEEEIHRSTWLPITYTLRYDGVILKDESAQIKGRGNYTWGMPKRPYAVKCDKRTDWFGFGAARDWVLLANITDQTLMRNQVAHTLAGLFGFAFACECRPAHVFIDGQYNGLYLITEKVEIDKARLALEDRAGDILLELDNNYGWGEPDAFQTDFGNLYVPKDPTNEELKADKENTTVTFKRALSNARQKINDFEQAVVGRTGFENFSQYMDMDSLVNWYIFNEIMKNDDTLFNSSIFLYNDYDGVLHMGPVWDYDLAMGGIDRNDGKNVDPEGFMFLEDYWGKPNWMRYALESTTLQNMIRARWQELYTSGTFEYIVSFLEQQREYLRDAYEVNYSVWHNEGVFVPSDSFDESVDYLKDFIVRRVAWLNSQWNDSGVTAAPVTAEPPATPTPVRTKAPSTPAPTSLPTDAAAETPAEAQRGSGDNEVLNYILIFIGLTAVLVTVILLTYLVISKIKERK